MTDDERELLTALAKMARQYLTRDEEKGELDSLCMSAGEHALLQLEKYGLVTIERPHIRIAYWTESGWDVVGRPRPKTDISSLLAPKPAKK